MSAAQFQISPWGFIADQNRHPKHHRLYDRMTKVLTKSRKKEQVVTTQNFRNPVWFHRTHKANFVAKPGSASLALC